MGAPAGAGKTLALTDWAAHRSSATSWLTMTGEVSSPRAFLAALAASIAQQIPTAAAAMDSAAAAGTVQDETLDLLLAAVGRTRRPLVSVFDQYERVQAPAVHRMVRTLLHRLSPEWHIVLASRTVPPVGLARLRVELELTELGVADLRFGPAEIRSYAAAAGVAVDDRIAEAAAAATDGWATGVRIAVRHTVAAGDSAALAGYSGADPVTVQYLQREVLSQLSALERDMVLQTSLAGSVDAALSVGMTGDLRAADTLRGISTRHTFLLPHRDRRGVLRYVRPFGAAFRHQLETERPAMAAEVRRRGAAWCIDHDRGSEAVSLLMKGGRHEVAQALALMDQHADTVVDVVPAAEILQWYDIAKRQPGGASVTVSLLAAHGAVGAGASPIQLVTARRKLERIDDPDVADGAALAVEWIRLRYLIATGQVANAAELAGRIQGWLAESPPADLGPWRGVSRVSATVAVALWLVGDTEGAVETLGAHLARRDPAGARWDGFGLWALIELQAGRNRLARQLAELCLPLPDASIADTGAGAYAELAALWTDLPEPTEPAGRPLRDRATADRACLGWLAHAERNARAGRHSEAGSALDAARSLASSIDAPGLMALVAVAASRLDSTRRAASPNELSRREREVLALLGSSLSKAEIAARLFVSVNTVKTHVRKIYGKLDVTSREEAVRVATELGLL